MKPRKNTKTDENVVEALGRNSEEVLDSTNDWGIKLSGVPRRDFLKIVNRYGTMATYAAVAGMGGVFSADALAASAESMYNKKFAKQAKHTLTLGTVFRHEHTKVQRAGVWEFAQDVEEMTDGELRIEILGGNSVCAEPVCVQKALQGAIDIAGCSTQNASGLVPWLNVMDYPYMFQSSGQIYHFLMSPESERLLRRVYREKYKMEFLWSLAEMRQLFMGEKWRDKPPITRIGDIAGSKIRVTNTQLGRIALQLMNLNPVPVAFVETLDAMKSGLIDGAEMWTTAATAFNMSPVISQYVGINFIPGTEHTAIRVQSLDKIGSHLADVVREASYRAQVYTMLNNEAGLIPISGESENPDPDSYFGKANTRMNFFTDEALAECEELANPDHKEFGEWHDKLNKLAGFEVYKEFLPVARAYPKDARAIDVEPRRWWKAL